MNLRWKLLGSTALLVAACSGEDGAPPDAEPIDSGVSSSGGPSTDAGVDGQVPDATAEDDAGVAAIVRGEPSGSVTSEGGASVTFTLALSRRPRGSVTIGMSSSDVDEGVVSPVSVQFTDDDWNQPKTITVTGVDDDVTDGDQVYFVGFAPAVAPGTDFHGLTLEPLRFVNADDDAPSLVVGTPSNAGRTTEAGGVVQFEVRLGAKPTATVRIPVISSDPSEGSVSPAVLELTPDDYATPQVITVTGVDDQEDDGDVAYRIELGPAESSDTGYQGLVGAPVELVNENDDTAALQLSAPSGTSTSETGGAVSFTVRLASKPTAAVTVPVASSAPLEASVSPGSLVFTPEDYATARTVTVTGLLDAVRDGDVAYQVTTGPAASADAKYQGLVGTPIALINRERLPASYTDYSVNHILATGQSNAVGEEAFPVLSTTQPYTNLMFDKGVMTVTPAGCNDARCTTYDPPSGLLPLVEGDRYRVTDPATGRETLSSGMANQISKRATEFFFTGSGLGKHDTLVSIHARSGTNYRCLRKAKCDWNMPQLFAFDEGMSQVQAARGFAQAAGRSYVVRAVTTVHGEDDHYLPQYLPTATYAAALLEWQHDYDTSIKAITGQQEDVPLYVMQLSGWKNDKKYSAVSEDQYNAHLQAPGKVILAAPTYMLSYAGTGCLHYTNVSQRKMGEYLGKAYAQTVFGGSPWEPLRPAEITRQGAVIRVRYLVPRPPLVFDTVAVSNPGSYGFEFSQANGTVVPIANVQLDGGDTVVITLSSAPAANGRLRYAERADYDACPRPGSRGNLRDSDPTPSQADGSPLYNWGVGYNVAVP